MNYIQISIIFLVLYISYPSLGQIDKLMGNPDIVWVSETFSICLLDENKKKIDSRYVDCENVLLKYIHKKGFSDFSKSPDSFYSFKQIMIDLINDKNAVLYNNHYLENRISTKEITDLKLKDSIFTFHPETFKEIMIPNTEEWQQKDIVYFNIKQVIYYSTKSKEIQTIPIAIAPMVYIRGNLHDLFWLPIDSKTKIQLENIDVNWINRTTYNIFTDEVEALKEKFSFLNIWDDLYFSINDTTLNHQYYYPSYRSNSNLNVYKVPNESLTYLPLCSIDTVITFDPETFNGIVQVYKYEIKHDFFYGIKIYQDWAWDEKNKKLIINQCAFSPIYTKYLMNSTLEEAENPVPYIIKTNKL